MTKRFRVIGCGGIGLHLIDPVCRYLYYQGGDFQISLIDGDTFEPKNAQRQPFDVLGPKATTTADRLRTQFRDIDVAEHPVYIDEKNVKNLIQEGDTVFLCVDNHATRKIVEDRAKELQNVVVISGGNDYIDGDCLVYIRQDGEEVTPPMSAHDPAIANPDMEEHPVKVAARTGCQAVVASAPQLVFANMAAATKMACAFYGLEQGVFSNEYLRYGRVQFSVKSNTARASLHTFPPVVPSVEENSEEASFA